MQQMTRPALTRICFAIALMLAVTGCVERPFWEKPDQPATAAASAASAAAEPFVDPRRQVEPSPPYEPGVRSVFPGSDRPLRATPPAGAGTSAARPLVRTETGDVSLNFVDTDIREVIRVILGDNLGVNYVVDPTVQGTVSLRTSRPIAAADLLLTLEEILALNGAALIQSPGLLKIVPADQAPRRGGTTAVASRRPLTGDRANVVLVPLQYIGASEMEKALQPFAAPGTHVGTNPQRNLLIIGGSPGGVANLLDVVDTFDVDWMAGMSFGLFPIRSTDPATMVDNLEAVFGNQKDGPLQGVLRLVPIDRLNSVLVVTSRSTYLNKVEQWVSRLDVGEDEVARIYVYFAENSRASDLANVLSDIFSPAEASRSRGLGPGLAASEVSTGRSGIRQRTGFSGSGGTSSDRTGANGERTATATGTADVTGGATGGGGGLGSGGGSSATAGPRGTARSTRGFGGTADLFGTTADATEIDLGTAGRIRVIADDVKNALVILAKPKDYRLVETALKQLDVLPLQVLIEATIVEVTLNDALEYGVEWFLKKGDVAATNRTTPNLGAIGTGAASAFNGFTFLFGNSNAQVLLTALEEISNIKVISSPSLFVLDNQTASLLVGDSVPVSTQSSVSVAAADAPQINSIEYKDTGVILDVTPRVNSGGLVTLEISQEVSSVIQTTSSTLDSPTIQQRRIESMVAVQTGDTVALGGLIQDRNEAGSTGIPYLSRIPFIGWLFGRESDVSDRTELLVLITPRVVPNQDSARRMTDELRQRMSQITNLEKRIQ